MKKTILSLIMAFAGVVSASAQFEQGKYYLAATTNSAGLSYSKESKFGLKVGLAWYF